MNVGETDLVLQYPSQRREEKKKKKGKAIKAAICDEWILALRRLLFRGKSSNLATVLHPRAMTQTQIICNFAFPICRVCVVRSNQTKSVGDWIIHFNKRSGKSQVSLRCPIYNFQCVFGHGFMSCFCGSTSARPNVIVAKSNLNWRLN